MKKFVVSGENLYFETVDENFGMETNRDIHVSHYSQYETAQDFNILYETNFVILLFH